MAQQINLYVKPPALSLPVVLTLLAVGVAWIGLIGWAVANELRVATRESERQEVLAATQGVQSQVAEKRVALGLPDAESQRKEISELRAKISANRDLIAQLDKGELGTRSGHSKALEAVALAGQKGLWLTALDITKSGQSLAVSGRAYDSDAVVRYSRRLNETMKNRGIDFQFSGLEMTKVPLLANSPRDTAAAKVEGIRFTLN